MNTHYSCPKSACFNFTDKVGDHRGRGLLHKSNLSDSHVLSFTDKGTTKI